MIILLFMQLLIPRYPFPWLFASYLSFDLDSKFLSHCSSALYFFCGILGPQSSATLTMPGVQESVSP